MTAQIIRPSTIDAPTPVRRRGGLLDVADVRNGIRWIDPNDLFLSFNCADTSATVICGPDPTPSKTFSSPVMIDGKAFVAYLGVQCKPLGDLQSEADRLFDLAESRAVERGFETSVLADATSVGTASTAIGALATLEQKLAERYLGAGTIHVTPRDATALFGNQLLVENGGKFYTHLGTKVAIGAGYTIGTMYATGDVVLYAGDRVSASGPNMVDNTMSALAERAYVAYTDCVKIKVTGVTAEGVSE